jgi:DNA-directed RNA polymerase subunit omega
MARVTVEDCILVIPNRFELVVVAAQRAKQISSGMPLTIDRDNDKDAVVSLREIADKTIDSKVVLEEIIQNFQKKSGFDSFDGSEDEENLASYTVTPNGDIEEAFTADSHFVEQQAQGAGMSFVEENIEVED